MLESNLKLKTDNMSKFIANLIGFLLQTRGEEMKAYICISNSDAVFRSEYNKGRF